MACKIAENEPLKRFRRELGLGVQCHSFRDNCIHKLDQPMGDYALGIPGAVIGYCQALFNRKGDSFHNTTRIIRLLSEINAPWEFSHELFWGNKQHESTDEFISLAVEPLQGRGRVPILITPLEPSQHFSIISEIVATDLAIFPNETTLLRIVIDSAESVSRSVQLIKRILSKSRHNQVMPKWWPLLQGNLDFEHWQMFRDLLGSDWQYVNIAVNPFTIDNLPDFCFDQVTVGQVVLGDASGVNSDGTIQMAKEMTIAGAKEMDTYSLPKYFEKLGQLEVVPTLIVLGPSLPEWTDKENQNRIAKLLPILKEACDALWKDVQNVSREEVWQLPA